MRARLVLAAAVLAAALAFAPLRAPGRAIAAAGSTLARPADPVVLTGADVPALQGTLPADIVAFRFSGAWTQIPVQVDQRFVQNFQTIYNNQQPAFLNANTSQLVYADPNTFTGADPVPTLDADDEIALMAPDAGGLATTAALPAHVLPGSGVELAITDPLAPGDHGWVYLFRQDGALDPAAGQQYVSYAFNLLSGAYKTTYRLAGGPNPEDSTVTTPSYARHFGDRWLDDTLRITAGASTGVDILDRHKALFAPGVCSRSEDTFDNGDTNGFPGEGAFIVNKSGPVRAIRSYIGANSGPNTQRDQIFYAQREDIRTALRVHAIPSIMDFFDYSPAATGMTYRNDLNTSGVAVDGVPDGVAAGPVQWEMVSGAQGSLVHAGSIATNIAGFAYTSYYEDNKTNPTTQCTGDAFAYAASGVWVNQSIPCTDPALGCTATLKTTRTLYYLPPGETAAQAATLAAQTRTPLAFSARAWSPAAAVGGIAVAPDFAAVARAANASGSGLTPGWPAAAAVLATVAATCAVALRRRRSTLIATDRRPLRAHRGRARRHGHKR